MITSTVRRKYCDFHVKSVKVSFITARRYVRHRRVSVRLYVCLSEKGANHLNLGGP